MLKKKKALILFSGGLDSMLSAKILENLNFSVTGLVFTSYFFNAEQAKKSASQIGLKLIKRDFSRAHLEIIKNPKYGRGVAMNPCIDCHALMLKKAYGIFKENKFNILATGEVLDQRPFSQHRRAFANIEKITDLERKILRPLSGKLLPETVYEKKRLVDKKNLEDIQGRSRIAQMKLAEKFGIEKYPTPAGGCLLTEKEYCEKLEKLLNFKKDLSKQDFELLKIGRHFWLDKQHIVLGRNKEENELIAKIKKSGMVIKPNYLKGPTAFVEFKNSKKNETMMKKVKRMIWNYSKDEKIKKFRENNYKVFLLE